ncbi:MAG: Holliday junction branch migration protein RuvA [Lachnospiraceae bacterium]|nr:Holliday junction branch migration protein RuvA [Lachnospiraceae bacterium]
MISYIKGNLVDVYNDKVVVETVSGVAFELRVPQKCIEVLPPVGSQTTLYTFMQINQEGEVQFCGFTERCILELFKKLITVSGVGIKNAIAILSAYDYAEVCNYIITEDAKMLSKVKGLGAKTASKLILELHDRIDFDSRQFASLEGYSETKFVSAKEDAIMALENFGMSAKEAYGLIKSIDDDNLTVEEYIRIALVNRK